MERQPNESSLATGQREQQHKEEVNLAAKGPAFQPPKKGQHENNSKGLRQHEGRKKKKYDGSPHIAKSKEEFKRVVDTLGIKYNIVYDP